MNVSVLPDVLPFGHQNSTLSLKTRDMNSKYMYISADNPAKGSVSS